MKEGTKARLAHLVILAVCFVVSLAITVASCPFAGPSTGDDLLPKLMFVFASHAIAFVVALLLPKITWRTSASIATICLIPALSFAAHAVKEEIHYRYFAVWDRFRDTLADPVPASVTSLRFTTLQETINPDLGFRFDIAPHDLKRIIRSKGLARKESHQLKCPEDFFRHPYYLPMQGKSVLYQGITGEGSVLTLKVDEAHTHAICRVESEVYYRDRGWEWPSRNREMAKEALDRMRKEYEAQRAPERDNG